MAAEQQLNKSDEIGKTANSDEIYGKGTKEDMNGPKLGKSGEYDIGKSEYGLIDTANEELPLIDGKAIQY